MKEKQEKILENFLQLINTGSKVSIFTLSAAASEAGITKPEMELLFPDGLFQIVEEAFQKHITELEALINLENGITQSVKNAVLASFSLLTPYKKGLRQIAKFLLLPQNLPFAPKFFWKISDTIWKGLKINDTGFSYYTKRITLSGVYANCFNYFLLSKKGEKLESILESSLSGVTKIARILKR